MKKLILNLLLMVFFLPVLAQEDTKIPRAKIEESIETMSQGDENAMVMILKDTKAKSAQKEWIKILKALKTKPKVEKSGEVFAEAVNLSGAKSPVNIYTIVKQQGNDAHVMVFTDMGDAFLKSETNPDEFGAMKALMRDLDLEMARQKVEDELKAQVKAQNKLEKELKNLKGDLEKMKEAVAKKQAEIVQLEKDQVQNNKDQALKEKEIDAQKAVVEEVKKELKKYKK